MKKQSHYSAIFIIPLIAIAAYTPDAYSHSLFNSSEEFIAGYRVQVATLPEFPNVGEQSQVLFRVTDKDFNEVDRFTMGVRIYYNGELIDEIKPKSYDGAHWVMNYIFENSGNHIFKVDLYDMGAPGVTTYTFNMSTQSPFGYIFFLSIIIGSTMFAIVLGYIYLPKRIKTRFGR